MTLSKSAREIEVKYRIDLATFEALKASMTPHDIADAGNDHFWDLNYPGVVAFLRYRQHPKEVTVKVEDGQGVSNRLEINLPVLADSKLVDIFKVFGAPHYSLFKAYYVWLSKDVEISLYYVDVLDSYFLEIEGTSLDLCQDAANHLITSVSGSYDLVDKSLFSLVKEKAALEAAKSPSSFRQTRR